MSICLVRHLLWAGITAGEGKAGLVGSLGRPLYPTAATPTRYPPCPPHRWPVHPAGSSTTGCTAGSSETFMASS